PSTDDQTRPRLVNRSQTNGRPKPRRGEGAGFVSRCTFEHGSELHLLAHRDVRGCGSEFCDHRRSRFLSSGDCGSPRDQHGKAKDYKQTSESAHYDSPERDCGKWNDMDSEARSSSVWG